MARKTRTKSDTATNSGDAANLAGERVPEGFLTRGSAPVEAIILNEKSPLYYIDPKKPINVRRIEEAAMQKMRDRIERQQISHATAWMFGGALTIAVISGTYGAGEAIGIGGIATFAALIGGAAYGSKTDKKHANAYKIDFYDLSRDEECWADLVARRLSSFGQQGSQKD